MGKLNVNRSNGRLPTRLPVTSIGMEAFLCGLRRSACSFAAHLVASTLSGPPLVTMVQTADLEVQRCHRSNNTKGNQIFLKGPLEP